MWVVYAGFARFDESFRQKNFASTSSSGYLDRNVVPLSNDRFAIITYSDISVYRVNEQGKVIRLDDVDTQYEWLQPNARSMNPEPRRTTVPSTTTTVP
jgi:hypothetical protein